MADISAFLRHRYLSAAADVAAHSGDICPTCGITLVLSNSDRHWFCPQCGDMVHFAPLVDDACVEFAPSHEPTALRAIKTKLAATGARTGVSEAVCARAAFWLEQVKTAGRQQFRATTTNDALIAGCLWLSAREHDCRLPSPPNGLGKKLEQFRSEVTSSVRSLAPTARALAEQWLADSLPPFPHTARLLVLFIAERIEQRRIIIEHQSGSIAAAVVWFVRSRCEVPESLTKAALCAIARISVVTLNKCLLKMEARESRFFPRACRRTLTEP